jgi:hypothetical protein
VAGVLVADGFVGGFARGLISSRLLRSPIRGHSVSDKVINCEFRGFHSSASSVACALHLLVGSFY